MLFYKAAQSKVFRFLRDFSQNPRKMLSIIGKPGAGKYHLVMSCLAELGIESIFEHGVNIETDEIVRINDVPRAVLLIRDFNYIRPGALQSLKRILLSGLRFPILITSVSKTAFLAKHATCVSITLTDAIILQFLRNAGFTGILRNVPKNLHICKRILEGAAYSDYSDYSDDKDDDKDRRITEYDIENMIELTQYQRQYLNRNTDLTQIPDLLSALNIYFARISD